jgi:hypothetical protein
MWSLILIWHCLLIRLARCAPTAVERILDSCLAVVMVQGLRVVRMFRVGRADCVPWVCMPCVAQSTSMRVADCRHLRGGRMTRGRPRIGLRP